MDHPISLHLVDNPGLDCVVSKFSSENKSVRDSSGVRERERVSTLLASYATLHLVCLCLCVFYFTVEKDEKDLTKDFTEEED